VRAETQSTAVRLVEVRGRCRHCAGWHNGAATILNAGHPPPLLLREGGVSELLVPPELPLGLVGSVRYPVHPIQLHPNDRLLLFTDGITEAHRRGERDFGYCRLAAMLAERSHLKPPELVRHLTRAVSESCSGVLSDDATAVCPDWHRPQAPGRTG
jgi:serine phosphatase RsbU (regulator of sigma subunit)